MGSRPYLTVMLTVGVGVILMGRFPFPDDNAMLLLIAAERPGIFAGIKGAYEAMRFSTPLIGASMLFSILYLVFVRPQESVALAPLPRIRWRPIESGFLVVGEMRHPKYPRPVGKPRWLMIPDRGLLHGAIEKAERNGHDF